MPLSDPQTQTPEAAAPPRDQAADAPESSAGNGPWLQLFDPVGFEWNRVTLPVRQLPVPLVGLRILHVTDFHLRRGWMSALDRLIDRVRRDPPDLLVCTGDFVENKRDHRPALPFVRQLVAGFVANLGCFGVMGNHDGTLADDLHAPHLTLMDRRREVFPFRGARIELIGLPRLERGIGPDQAFIDSLPPRNDGVPRIVLSHYSDYLGRILPKDPDLFLAGHTHGGQVCLPGGIPILKHTSLPRRLCRGTHRINHTWLVANRGLGFSSLPIRLFCPGEVVEIVLARET